jgi:hypothetical protein
MGLVTTRLIAWLEPEPGTQMIPVATSSVHGIVLPKTGELYFVALSTVSSEPSSLLSLVTLILSIF